MSWPSTGPKTATGVQLSGTGAVWTATGPNLVSDLATSDNVRAIASVPPQDVSQFLIPYAFNFDIPLGSIIKGFVMRVERSTGGGVGIRDIYIRLKVNLEMSVEKSTGALWPGVSDEVKVFGGNEDLWGLSPTAEDVNTNVRAYVQVENEHASVAIDAKVDKVSVEVFYLPPNDTIISATDPGRIFSAIGRTLGNPAGSSRALL